MKSFEKFNTEAMVHHIALKEGMSYDELSEQLAGDMPGGLGGAIMTGVVGAGGWALRNLKRSLTDTRPVFRDYGQSTVTKAQTSQNQPTGASGSEGSVTARRQAQRAARQQPTGSGSPTPKPPKPEPPKKPSLKSTAAALATAAAPAGSTRTAGADKADPHPMKTKPEGQVEVNPLFKQPKLNPEQEKNKAAEAIFKLKPGSLEKKPEPEKKKTELPKPIVTKPEGRPPTPRPIPLNRRRTSPATTTTTGIPVY